MRLKNYLFILTAGAFSILLSSCENSDKEFSDFEGGTSVYFAYQYPIRTLVMGSDENNTSMDKAHKFNILATMGGSYSGRDIVMNLNVDNSLCDNLLFEDGTAVKAMPTEYYSLAGNTISYRGDVKGALEVQLTDAFFADPDAVKNTYVIPLVIENQTGADAILSGTPLIEGETPARTNSAYWSVLPKDYVLYCVKYISKYHAYYLRRGVDTITEGSVVTTNVRHQATVEEDEICFAETRSLNTVVYTIKINDKAYNLILTFNGNDECTVTTESDEYTVTGTGKYSEKSEIKAWGDKDRDGLYLDYTLNLGTVTYETKDTLVWQRNGVVMPVEFTPTYQE